MIDIWVVENLFKGNLSLRSIKKKNLTCATRRGKWTPTPTPLLLLSVPPLIWPPPAAELLSTELSRCSGAAPLSAETVLSTDGWDIVNGGGVDALAVEVGKVGFWMGIPGADSPVVGIDRVWPGAGVRIDLAGTGLGLAGIGGGVGVDCCSMKTSSSSLVSSSSSSNGCLN